MIVHQDRRTEMNAFLSTLPTVIEAIDASDEVRDAFVFATWRSVAGGQVSDRTEPLAIEGKRLIVAVADRTWKRNLETLASQLVFKLNTSLGKPLVDYIEFRIAPDALSRVGEVLGEFVDDVPAPVEVSVSARKIRDSTLRDTVLKAAANCLARNR